MERVFTKCAIDKWIEIIPSLLWVIFAVVIFFLFYKRIRDDLLPNLGGFKAMGVEFAFVEKSIDAALELAEKSPKWKVHVSEEEKNRALNRAKKHLDIFKDSKILWVDDIPENNENEQRMFLQLNVEIDEATHTEQALEMLNKNKYDLIISDMARGDDKTAGLTLLTKLKNKKNMPPLILYVGIINPDLGVPGYAFGITNHPMNCCIWRWMHWKGKNIEPYEKLDCISGVDHKCYVKFILYWINLVINLLNSLPGMLGRGIGGLLCQKN